MECHVSFKDSFEASKGNHVSWTGSFIEECSIFDEKGNLSLKKIGRSKREESHHTIVFHRKIVDAIDPGKDPRTRLFLSEIFKRGLSQAEQIIYRYFYGHWDSEEVWKSVYKPHEGLIDIFKWTSHRSQFLPWVLKSLDGLKKQGLVEYYRLNDDKSAVAVKCFNINEIKDKELKITLISDHDNPENLVTIDGQIVDKEVETTKRVNKATESRRKGAYKAPEEFDISKLTDEAVVAEYLIRKERGLISESKVEIIDDLMASQPKKLWLPILRKHLLSGAPKERSKPKERKSAFSHSTLPNGELDPKWLESLKAEEVLDEYEYRKENNLLNQFQEQTIPILLSSVKSGKSKLLMDMVAMALCREESKPTSKESPCYDG